VVFGGGLHDPLLNSGILSQHHWLVAPAMRTGSFTARASAAIRVDGNSDALLRGVSFYGLTLIHSISDSQTTESPLHQPVKQSFSANC
jgi:hypothetical protein